jgi:8-oxo-dGTP pyrophosphatase MutT (NUDIX family)
MRQRPAARLLVVAPDDRLLLFKFHFRQGPLAGRQFWATPGGAVDPGETFEQAAVRELLEETGLRIEDPGPQIAKRQAVFQTPDGEHVAADERFFLVRVNNAILSRVGWTKLEQEVMTEHRWWSANEIRESQEQIWPEGLADVLAGVASNR